MKPAPVAAALAARPTDRKGFWFRLAAFLGVPVLLLAATEGGLRLAGFGHPAGFFLLRHLNGQLVWTDNQAFGERFFPPGLVRYPRPVTLPAAKPAHTLRVFVLGESAAQGDPAPRFGLARMLEVLLRERFPQRRIEVVDAAMVAINSHAILPIARACAKCQGDLWVIYMGNNEMIGPFGALSVFGPQTPPLPVIHANLALKATRLGQLLDLGLRRLRLGSQPPAEWGGMSMWAGQSIRLDQKRTARVYHHFQANLAAILAAGRQAGVKVILCTVPTNLRDCAPFSALHRADLSAPKLAECEAAYRQGVAAQSQGNWAEADSCYQRAAAIDDHFADLTFRRAECCLALGQLAQAQQYFQAARDQDALQFRADGRINQIIRQSAAAGANPDVQLLDAEALFAANSPQGLVGENYFYEHVHLKPEGNYLLARAVAERAAAALGLLRPTNDLPQQVGESGGFPANALPPTALSSGAALSWISESECLAQLGFTDWNRYSILKEVLERVESFPYTRQVNHAQQAQALRQELEQYRAASKPAQVRRAAQQAAQALARRPEDADLRWNLAELLNQSGDLAQAEEQWRAVIRLQPQAIWACYNLALLLESCQRHAEARALYRQCLRINPRFFEALHSLGLALSRQGEFREAARFLRLAVREKPGSAKTRLALGQALVQARQPAAAARQFREVLRLEPGNPQARQGLESIRRAN